MKKNLFSVLALFRLYVLRPEASEYYEKKENIIKRLLSLISDPEKKEKEKEKEKEKKDDAPFPAQTMALCTISNLFSRPSFAKLLANSGEVVTAACNALRSSDKSLRSVSSNLLFNCALFLPKDDSDLVVECVTSLSDIVINESDADTSAQMLLGLGQFLLDNSNSIMILQAMDLNLNSLLSRFNDHKKINSLINEINLLLSSSS